MFSSSNNKDQEAKHTKSCSPESELQPTEDGEMEGIDYSEIDLDFSKLGKRRTKQDPISVTNLFFPLSLYSDWYPGPIELKVTASIKDWEELKEYFDEDPNGFAHKFHGLFIEKALEEIHRQGEKRPRGPHAQRSHIVWKFRWFAGPLYAFFYYWCKKPLGDWPSYLKRLVDMGEREGYTLKPMNGKAQLSSIGLTIYCMEKIYGKTAKRYGLKPFEDPNNFYITYIQAERRAERTKKEDIGNKGPEEVARLGFELPPLRMIFGALQII